MGKSKIEWTDEVWNPVTGCNKVSSGCKYCYAERWFPRVAPGRMFTDVQLHEERLDQPLRWRKPRLVFVNSMSDLFHESVPFSFVDQVFAVMAITPRHKYQILTKRPQRMLEYFQSFHCVSSHVNQLANEAENLFGESAASWISNYLRGWSMPQEVLDDGNPCDGSKKRWPIPNVWLGVSVEDQKTADERIPILLKCPAVVRFVSYEPALGAIDLGLYLFWKKGLTIFNYLDWVICGGESGPEARPMHPDWVRSVRDQCLDANVPFFFKQWGEWKPYNEKEAKSVSSGFKQHNFGDGWISKKVGKKIAGCELDGEVWQQWPE